MGTKVKNPSIYWEHEAVAAWGFYFNDINYILNNLEFFLIDYISITLKYGINIPFLAYNENIYDPKIIVSKLLSKDEEDIYKRWGRIIRGNYFNYDLKEHDIPCTMFITTETGNIQKKIFTKNNYGSFFNIFSTFNPKEENFSIYFSLTTNAFFDEIWSSRTYKDKLKGVDNSDLAYLNTTRLNSYIRALYTLFENYKVDNCEFSNFFDGNLNNRSKYFNEQFLKIKNEIVFYEDIFDILPIEHRYTLFEDFSEIKKEKQKKAIQIDNKEKNTLKKNNFKNNLIKNYNDVKTLSWDQFYTNFVVNSFNMSDEEYHEYLKSIKCPFGFIGKASKAKEEYKKIKDVKNLEDEIKKVVSVIASGNSFKKKNTSLNEWLRSKKWQDFNSKMTFSILEIASFENGNNYIKTKIMEMPIFKIF